MEGLPQIRDYIELDRKFVAVDDHSQATEQDDRLFAPSVSLGTEESWADILRNPCTVVQAEARAGKTTELRAQACKLRGENEAAFFCRLEILAEASLESALEIGTRQEFQSWAGSDAPGYFFLDSVDEARLASSRDFERAIIRFVEAVESCAAPLKVVISTRPNAWLAQADFAMLRGRLAFLQERQTVRNDTDSPDFNQDGRSLVPENETTRAVETGDISPVVIRKMTPLNQDQVRTFAEAKGVTDIDGFLEAIEHADADIFATRPADLRGLIAYWNEHSRLGSYAEIVARDIALKLSEENPTHSDESPISADRAHAGATRLAAAATLTKRSAILLPDASVDETLSSKCIDPGLVLPDWNPGEIRTLLGRGLFDVALYGSVRFNHRTAREYLAALWFYELLLQRTQRRNIERLFFAHPYGILSEVVRPSLKPIVGWLAIRDQRIRDRAVHIDPKVLLEYGNTSALDIGTRETLLRDFARRYENRQNTPLSLDIREVRRLADDGLAGVIAELLQTYRAHVDVSRLLLRMIWEGRISDCGPLAYTFAVNTDVDVSTRSIAIRAVESVGTSAEQRRLAEEILAQASSLSHDIINTAIDSLWPNALTDQDVLRVLEEIPNPGRLGAPSLEYVILRIPDRISDRSRVRNFLAAILELASRPPFLGDEFCRISERYNWLLNLLWALARRLRALHEAPETVPEFLEAIALCSQSRSYVSHYRGRMDNEIAELLHDNAEIRHALFWHECTQARRPEAQPITDWRFIYRFRNNLDTRDSEFYLRDIRERADLDDKRVAMSVLFGICNARENTDLLGRIGDVVNGNSDLEAEFDRLSTPPTPPETYLEEQRRRSEEEEQRRQQEREEAQARQDWIERLRADPSMVGDLSLAEEGRIWNNTHWLLEEIREETHEENRLTASHWELLIPNFGETVAQQFRDFCRAFWRHYTPPLRPENADGSQTIPHALIVGLSGLAMEANGDETWAERLPDDEAEIATRYALQEMNDFPAWFLTLLQAKPEPVRRLLRQEVEWECGAFPPDGLLLYVLEKLRTTRVQVGNDLRDDIADILETNEEVSINPLKSALAIILKNDTPLPQTFQDSVARRAEAASSEQQQALWLSALLCLDAERALNIMEPWVHSGTQQEGERRTSLILNHLWGRDTDSFNSEWRSYERPDCFSRLLEIVYSHVQSEEDIQLSSARFLELRDNAQYARDHLLQLFCRVPGQPTYEALITLSESQPPGYFKDHLLNLAERRIEDDADFQAWPESQVAEWTRNAERDPGTQQELFEIAVSRLDDIKLDLEEGDESEASLWRRVDDEIELRRVIASRLRLTSRNKYTTGSEEELADRSRTDIRLHHPNVEARIPIEIKIAKRWSANKLRERMETQLGGQYLREAHYGIFLLVNRGAESDGQSWRPEGEGLVDFLALVQWLKDESTTILNTHEQVQEIEVIGIDLTRRTEA